MNGDNKAQPINRNGYGQDTEAKANGHLQTKLFPLQSVQWGIQSGNKPIEPGQGRAQLRRGSLPANVLPLQNKPPLFSIFQKKSTSSAPTTAAAATTTTTTTTTKTTTTTTATPIFKFDPTVNRPQVLAPGSLESVGMQRLKEKTNCAFQWASPYPQISSSSSSSSSSTTTTTTTTAQSSSRGVVPPTSSTTEATLSKSFMSQLLTVAPKNNVTQKSVQFDGVRRSAESIESENKEIDPALRKRRTSESLAIKATLRDAGGTPMGRLLLSNKEEKGGGGGGRDAIDEPGQAMKSDRPIGPHEFLELYRSRAYSDPRQFDTTKTANSKRHKKQSSENQTHFSNMSIHIEHCDDGTDAEPKHIPMNLYRRRMSLSVGVIRELPDTIPENSEISFRGSFISLPSASRVADGSKWKRIPVDEDTESDNNNKLKEEKTGRRFSESQVPNLQELLTLESLSMKARLCPHRSSSESLNSIVSIKKTSDCLISPESLGIELPLILKHHLIIWRDRKSTQILQLPVVRYPENIQEILTNGGNLIYSELMKFHRCCELMPRSSTVVLLDIHLKAATAFYALTVNGQKAAPLWDSVAGNVVGMLTVTDFIRMLLLYHNSKEDLEKLADETVFSWKERLGVKPHLTFADADDSIYDAISSLSSNSIHRLPVIDTVKNNILYTLNYKRLLKFICLFMNNLPIPSFMERSIWDLRVGAFDYVVSIGVDRPLYEALQLLYKERVSSVPVVDNNGRVVNIYSKTDAMGLAANDSYKNLDATLGEVLPNRGENFEGVYLCKRTDSLSQVIEWMVKTDVHRLVVVDDDRKLQGIVSLSDVVRCLVLQPPTRDDRLQKDCSEEASISPPEADEIQTEQDIKEEVSSL